MGIRKIDAIQAKITDVALDSMAHLDGHRPAK